MCIYRLCKAILRYNNGSMLNHIKYKHPATVTEALGRKSKTTVGVNYQVIIIIIHHVSLSIGY